ncbi:MAG: hypothetical protein ACRD0B_03630 [Acidimicrobiales bacterium]
MSGYVEAGYVVALATLGGYSLSILARERASRRRLPDGAGGAVEAAEGGDGLGAIEREAGTR